MRHLKPFIPAALPLALVVVVAGAARAEGLSVGLDHAARLDVRGAANVVVGNPSVADVTVVDSRSVFVTGRAYGSTSVLVSDRDGRTLYAGDVTVGTPASTVSVYRGTDRTEVACAPGCAPAGGAGGPSH